MGTKNIRYSKRIADRICYLMAERHLPLLQICGRPEDNIPPIEPGLPSYRTVHLWRKSIPEFAAAYQEALELHFLAGADDLIRIADEPPVMATIISENGNRSRRVDSGAEMHRRTRIDTRKWILARMLPKVFGDRIAHGFLGKDGEPVDPPAIHMGFANGGPGSDPETGDSGGDPEPSP